MELKASKAAGDLYLLLDDTEKHHLDGIEDDPIATVCGRS